MVLGPFVRDIVQANREYALCRAGYLFPSYFFLFDFIFDDASSETSSMHIYPNGKHKRQSLCE